MPEQFSAEQLASIRESLPNELKSMNDAELSAALIAEFNKIDEQVMSAATSALGKLPDVVGSMSPAELQAFATADKDTLTNAVTEGIVTKIEKDAGWSSS